MPKSPDKSTVSERGVPALRSLCSPLNRYPDRRRQGDPLHPSGLTMRNVCDADVSDAVLHATLARRAERSRTLPTPLPVPMQR